MMKLSTSLVEDHTMKPPLTSSKMLVSPVIWNVIFKTKNKFFVGSKINNRAGWLYLTTPVSADTTYSLESIYNMIA